MPGRPPSAASQRRPMKRDQSHRRDQSRDPVARPGGACRGVLDIMRGCPLGGCPPLFEVRLAATEIDVWLYCTGLCASAIRESGICLGHNTASGRRGPAAVAPGPPRPRKPSGRRRQLWRQQLRRREGRPAETPKVECSPRLHHRRARPAPWRASWRPIGGHPTIGAEALEIIWAVPTDDGGE